MEIDHPRPAYLEVDNFEPKAFRVIHLHHFVKYKNFFLDISIHFHLLGQQYRTVLQMIDTSFYGVSANKKYRDKNSEDAFSGKALTVTEIHGGNFTLRIPIIQSSLSSCSLGGILPALQVNGDCSTGHGRLSFRLGIFYRIDSVHFIYFTKPVHWYHSFRHAV
jgi:hypothetical protein